MLHITQYLHVKADNHNATVIRYKGKLKIKSVAYSSQGNHTGQLVIHGNLLQFQEIQNKHTRELIKTQTCYLSAETNTNITKTAEIIYNLKTIQMQKWLIK